MKRCVNRIAQFLRKNWPAVTESSTWKSCKCLAEIGNHRFVVNGNLLSKFLPIKLYNTDYDRNRSTITHEIVPQFIRIGCFTFRKKKHYLFSYERNRNRVFIRSTIFRKCIRCFFHLNIRFDSYSSSHYALQLTSLRCRTLDGKRLSLVRRTSLMCCDRLR